MKAELYKKVRSLIFAKDQQTLSCRNSSTHNVESGVYESNLENPETRKIVSIPLLFLHSGFPDYFFFSFWSAGGDRLEEIHGIVRAGRNRKAHVNRCRNSS